MTLQEFLASRGYQYNDDIGQYRPIEGGGVDQEVVQRDIDAYNAFGGDFSKLAQMGGYQGTNPAMFLMGLEDASGNKVPFGNWAINGNPLLNSGIMGTNLSGEIQDYAMPYLQQAGITPEMLAAGSKVSGSGLGELLTYMPMIIPALMTAGGAFTGVGEFAGAAGSGASGAGAGVADAAWGVNPASSSQFSLAGGTAGTPAGGLYSGAGGVTGLTPGGAGITGLTGTASAGSLLTPAMAASMGLPASAAMGGSGLTAAQVMGGVGGASEAVQGGSALSRLLGLGQKGTDALSLAGTLGATGLGMYGANQQADAYENIANKYLDLGAPYRNLLQQSYQPGFSMANQPDFQNALDTSANSLARAVSAKSGNPYDNPGVMMEAQKYLAGNLALPQLNTYRSQLGSFGQLGTNTAGTADTAAASQTGGMYNALGYGLGQLTQPKNPFEDLMKGLLGGGFKLNTGLSF